MASSNGADEAALDRSYRVSEPMDVATATTLLIEAKQILDRLGVVFFLRQGTCLGAIRDNGFISWDDDLDLGSVFGLHGFAERSVDRVATAFRDKGYFVRVDRNDHYIALAMMKSFIRMDWACHHIIDDSIFHFPGVRIPVRLLTHLKEIDFIGDKFLVPNPPEEYLRFKYGPDWVIPKKTGYEKDVVEMIPTSSIPGRPSRLRQFLNNHILRRRTCRLKILDYEGNPVAGAEIVVPGLGRFITSKQGDTEFYLPAKDLFALIIRFGSHEEVLYQEFMTPGHSYVYRSDASLASGRLMVLSPE